MQQFMNFDCDLFFRQLSSEALSILRKEEKEKDAPKYQNNNGEEIE